MASMLMKRILEKIVNGRTDLVAVYLDEGNPANKSDAQGISIMQWCAYHGDVSAVRLLIEHGASLKLLGSDLGINAAAFHGHWQLCQFLLENGAGPRSALPDTGETPLHAALCRANRPVDAHIVRLLLNHKADPNAPTRPGAETGAFMRDCRTRGETPLHRAAAFGSLAAIEQLLAAGADKMLKDAHGDTPLSWASWHLRPPEVLRLLCYGSFSIHPENDADYDHGRGWGQLDLHRRGKPLL